MELTGKIEKIGNVQEISASFKKRELVIRTEEQYPQPLLIEFTQEKTDLLNGFNLGDRVTVGINIRGREWRRNPQDEAKYFVSIQGWRIQTVTPQPSGSSASEPSAPIMPEGPAQDFSARPEEDDLPF
jgi:hypothetical protein